MRKLLSFLNCGTSAVSILALVSLDLGTAQAETVAVNPTVEPVSVTREQLLQAESNSAGTLIGAVKPAYDVIDFITPTAQTIDELIQSAAQAEVLKPAYTVDQFSPKAIAQAKKPAPPKPAPPKPEDDDPEELEEVRVETGRTRSKESTETTATYTVTQQAITASGATTVSGVLVKLLPSFAASESLGGINTDQGVFLRGLGSNRFSVLIDGRPTTRPGNNRSADLGRLGVSNIERIEVFTGPAGLRYGAGAIAGTINIITRLPDKERLTLTAEGGSYGFSRETVNYTNTNGLKIGTAGYIGYELNYERRSALNNYTGIAVEQPTGLGIRFPTSIPEGVIPPNAPSVILDDNDPTSFFYQVPISYQKTTRGAYVFSDNYAAKIVYQPAIDHILRASVSVSSIRSGDQFANLNGLANCTVVPRGFGVSPEIDPSDLINPASINFYDRTECNISFANPSSFRIADLTGRGDQAEDNITGSLGWEWALTKENKLTFLSSFSASFETNPSSPGTRTASSQIVDAQFNYSSELSKNNTFNAGVEYFQQRFNATPIPGAGGNQFFPPTTQQNTGFFAVDITKRSLAFYATDQWRFFDDALVIDLGVRSTTDQFFGTYTTPGAGLRWNFGGPRGQEPFAFRASWFQSFRAPGLADIFGYTGFNAGQARSDFGSANVLRNLALKPETGVSYDLGFDFKISPTSLFRVTYFRNDLNNGIVGNVGIIPLPKQIAGPNGIINVYTPEQLAALRFPAQCPSSPGVTFPGTSGNVTASATPIINGQDTCLAPLTTTLNAQSYLSTGWEFSYRWQIIPQLELNASYSFIDSRPTGDPFSNFITDTDTGIDVPLGSGGVEGGYFYGYQPRDIPFTTGNFGLRYNSNRYRVALSTSFVGLRPRAVAGNNYYQPYSRWDLTFGIPLTEELTFTGGAYNIFGDRSVIGDNGVGIGAGVLQPPPTYRFGIEATFGSN